MLETFESVTDNAIYYVQLYGMLFGFFLIVLESILPWLPLCVFIALNVSAFGNILGYLISYSATITGCLLSYFFFKYFIGKRISKTKNIRLKKIIKAVKKINFSSLVIFVALPFSPAFLINIACGVSNVNFKKFFLSLLIGKLVIVYFWGFVGTSIIESLTDISKFIIICLLLAGTYIISKIVNKKLKVE